MNQTQKDQWLTDLRSGKYPQGRGWLYSEDGFCCLGVYADRQYVQTGKAWWRQDQDRGHFYLIGDEIFEGCFISQTGEIRYSQQTHLSSMNDGVDDVPSASFAEIADWIEKNVEVTE